MKKLYFLILVVLAGCTQKVTNDNDLRRNQYGNPCQLVNYHPQRYVCYRTNAPITIDGKADEMVWQIIPWNIEFSDVLGEQTSKSAYLTRAKMLWDDDYVYIAAEMMEPHIRASRRVEEITLDNHFSVFIDIEGSTHNYLELTFDANGFYYVKAYQSNNKAGTFWSDGKSAQIGNAIHLEGSLNNPSDEDHYWSLEIALPIHQLIGARDFLEPDKGIQWRVNFQRTQWNATVVDGYYKQVIDSESGLVYPPERWVWSPVGDNNVHKPELWGYVQFSEIKAGGGREVFVYNPDEDLKWELRNIFYAQQQFYHKNERYAKRFGELRQVGFIPKALLYKPEMDARDIGFTAKALSLNGDAIWFINQDGLVWHQPVK